MKPERIKQIRDHIDCRWRGHEDLRECLSDIERLEADNVNLRKLMAGTFTGEIAIHNEAAGKVIGRENPQEPHNYLAGAPVTAHFQTKGIPKAEAAGGE